MALKEFVTWIKSMWAPSSTWERAGASIAEWVLTGGQVTIQEALSHPAVWRAVNVISADVAKVPISLYRRDEDGGRTAENDWPSAIVLREQAAPGMTGYTLRRTLTAHALLTGNGFAWIQRNGIGDPVALTVLDPLRTQPVDEGRLAWKTRLPTGQDTTISDDDILHIAGLTWDGVFGDSPLRLLAEAIRLELGVQRFAAAFFQKGYALSGFIKSPRALSADEVARLRDEFRRRHSSASNAHDIAILSGGLEFQPSVAEPQKSQLVESRDAGLRAIANVFGLPPHKLGDPTRTSYASIEAENADYLQTTLDPWLVAWETEATAKLLSKALKKKRYYFEHNRNAIVRTQISERVAAYAKLVEIGVLSPNEVRERENLNRRSGGDAYYTPANWIRSGTGFTGNQAVTAETPGAD